MAKRTGFGSMLNTLHYLCRLFSRYSASIDAAIDASNATPAQKDQLKGLVIVIKDACLVVDTLRPVFEK